LRCKLVVRFAIDGDLRFISHQDTVRLFERALARAEWPVKFSEGFNPRPRLSLPLPRNVGLASDDELLVMEMTQTIDPDEALRRLSGQVPAGIRLLSAMASSARTGPQPLRAWYEVRLDPTVPLLDEGIAALMKRETCGVTRTTPDEKAPRTVDIRPYVEAIVRDGSDLRLVLRVTPTGTARPVEVLNALGLPGDQLAHRLRRTRVEWAVADDDTEHGRPDPPEPTAVA
jgi:radical SAM-linked protein